MGSVVLYTGSAKVLNKAITTIAEPEDGLVEYAIFPPALLAALAGASPEAVCLPPEPLDLIDLDGSWPEFGQDRAAAVSRAIGSAFDAAMQGRPWLNRWTDSNPAHPTGLWLWSNRRTRDVYPLNGGEMAMNHHVAVLDALGYLISLRISYGPWSRTPPGYGLMSSACPWTFRETPWNPRQDNEVQVRRVIERHHLPEVRPVDPADGVDPASTVRDT